MNTSIISSFGHIGKIFLVGFMGSGKSFWGHKWSQKYKLPIFDLDKNIEKAEKLSIATIFEKQGEENFRKIEATILRTFINKDNCIIASGGGTPCFAGNMQWMNKNGKTIYLAASPKYIYEKIVDEQAKRPLIKNLNPSELLFFIEQKLKEREFFYKQASVILPVEGMTEEFVPEFITDHLQNT